MAHCSYVWVGAIVLQAQSEQLASRHKEEQAKLLADLEARTSALSATQATVAEREAAHASLQQHCKDLQVSLQYVSACII
jgi:septal ring factor EnvC (AmiA/AmiB activator)